MTFRRVSPKTSRRSCRTRRPTASARCEDIGRRFDDIVDLSAGTLGNLSEDQLAARARWSGLPVDVRFRINRWSSHIREHTIQVEKTLGFINRPTSEVDRLLRLIAAAYGRLEDEVFMLPESPALADALRLVESTARAPRATPSRSAQRG